MAVDIAEDVAAGVEEDDQRQPTRRRRTHGPVEPHRDRRGIPRPRDLEILDRADRRLGIEVPFLDEGIDMRPCLLGSHVGDLARLRAV